MSSVARSPILFAMLLAVLSSCGQLLSLTTAPPTSNAGHDQTGAIVGLVVQLDGTGSSGGTSYTWSFSQVPTGSALTNTNITDSSKQSASFTPDVAGIFILKLLVTNSGGNNTSTVKVTASEHFCLLLHQHQPAGRRHDNRNGDHRDGPLRHQRDDARRHVYLQHHECHGRGGGPGERDHAERLHEPRDLCVDDEFRGSDL